MPLFRRMLKSSHTAGFKCSLHVARVIQGATELLAPGITAAQGSRRCKGCMLVARRGVQGVNQLINLLLHLLQVPLLDGRMLVHIRPDKVVELVLQTIFQVGHAAIHGRQSRFATLQPIQNREARSLLRFLHRLVCGDPGLALGFTAMLLETFAESLLFVLAPLLLVLDRAAEVSQPGQRQVQGTLLKHGVASSEAFQISIEVSQRSASLHGQ
mmetsp:Transcript_11102/g.23143  ORF Transcript_11102/g.23143 Transcript_11102/m.23143 type:complete len:213 (+) Transcript_11102:41-679(+)